MSVETALDLDLFCQRFLVRLEGRLLRISERLAMLKNEPGRDAAHALMLEFHALHGTAGTLGFDSIAECAAAAEESCDAMIRNENFDRPADLSAIEQRITEIRSTMSPHRLLLAP